MEKKNTTKWKTKEERIRIVELEIQFAKGWNSKTTMPLPNWKQWKRKLYPSMSDFEAFEAGVFEYITSGRISGF